MLNSLYRDNRENFLASVFLRQVNTITETASNRSVLHRGEGPRIARDFLNGSMKKFGKKSGKYYAKKYIKNCSRFRVCE